MQFIKIEHVQQILNDNCPPPKKDNVPNTATVAFPQDKKYVLTHSRSFLSHPDGFSTYKNPVFNKTNPKPIKKPRKTSKKHKTI